jgi:hypothetical protein
MDIGLTLGFEGNTKLINVEIVSGAEAMTMIITIRDGRSVKIGTPFNMFTNQDCNYSIQEVLDDVHGISYKLSPKGEWIRFCLILNSMIPLSLQEMCLGIQKVFG